MAHRYIIGKSGVGKSTFIKQQILNDIHAGNAVVFVDPHGADTDDLLRLIPKNRVKDTILFDPTDPTYLISWNPLSETDDIPLLANVMTNSIRAAWGMTDIATPNVSMIVESLIYTAVQYDKTILECLYLLFDPEVPETGNPVLDLFWDTYIAKGQKDREAINSSTVNKLFTLLLDPKMQSLFGTRKGRLVVSDAVKDKILFVKLPQGKLGVDKVRLLGSIMLAQVHLASLRRDPNIPLSIYVDEVHSFAWSSIAEMLSGLRKFNVHITVAHQFIDQLNKTLFASLMGNCDYKLVFRVSPEDAEYFEEHKKFPAVCNLEKLPPYRYRTFPRHTSDQDKWVDELPEPKVAGMADRVITHTRRNYCKEIK